MCTICVDAMVKVREQSATTSGQVFNVGGGPQRAFSVMEMLHSIEQVTGKTVRLEHREVRPGDQPLYISDTSKLELLTGWKPRRELTTDPGGHSRVLARSSRAVRLRPACWCAQCAWRSGMKYALINPRWTFEGSTYFGCPEPHFPLELLYAQQTLRKAGHDVLLIDAFMGSLNPDEVRQRLAGFDEDYLVDTYRALVSLLAVSAARTSRTAAVDLLRSSESPQEWSSGRMARQLRKQLWRRLVQILSCAASPTRPFQCSPIHHGKPSTAAAGEMRMAPSTWARASASPICSSMGSLDYSDLSR